MKQHILLLSCLLLLIFSSVCHGANGASFDCEKASTPTEKCICSDTRLSYADGWLTDTYLKRMKFLSQEEKKNLKAEQIAWLKKRGKVCKQSQEDTKSNMYGIDKGCLKKMYEERTKELSSKIPGLSRFDLKPAPDLERTILESKQFFELPEYYYRLSDHEYLFPIDEQGGRQQLGLYYADTKTNTLDKIISWYPSIEGVIQAKGITWLIVYYTDLDRGFSSDGYKAIMIKDKNYSKKPYQLFDLASIYSPYIEEDYGEADPCPHISDSQKERGNSFSELKGYDVKDLNGDGINDMVFRIERFDCKTNKHDSIIETYYFFPQDPFMEKKEQKK